MSSQLDARIAELKAQTSLMTPHSAEDELKYGRLCRALDLLAELPAKVAAQGPFATGAEARAVLDRETHAILNVLDGIQ